MSLKNFIKLGFGRSFVDPLPKCEVRHMNTPFNSIYVLLANFIFSLIAIIHLAYLGASFDLSEEVSLILVYSYLFIFTGTAVFLRLPR